MIRVPQGGGADLVAVRRVSGKTVSLRDATSVLTADNATLYVAYWSEEQNETGANVKVRSQAHQGQVTVVLTETGPTSGEFVLKIMLSEPSTDADNPSMFSVDSDGLGSLPANPRDVVTLTHPDSTGTITVETDRPGLLRFCACSQHLRKRRSA